MDPQLPPQSESEETSPARRRSSIAYDPARDKFTEIPNTVPEEVISNGSHSMTSSPAQAKNKNMSSSPESRKRQRPGSPTNGAAEHATHGQGPPQKRPRSEERETPTDGTATPASGSATQKPGSRTTRIPKVVREEGEVSNRPARTPAAFTNRRPDMNQESRRRPDDERPRDYGRVRDRPKRRSRSPERRVPSAYRRRSPPRPTKRDPSPISRSPSPIRDSPPRDLPRPGGGRGRGRNVLAEQERLRAEREKAQGLSTVNRGVQGVVNEWYNAVPEYVKERGRDWRRNESQIKGLRSFNNWVKSCIIQKFSPQEKAVEQEEELGWGETAKVPEEIKPLLVLDVGCGKGGDLGKWEKAPQPVGLYTGLDPADQSISQAQDRYKTMWKGRRPRFDARFAVKDCFDPKPNAMDRWGKGGGFDVVTMMFSMHYSFESQDKVEMMLRNVSGALKKGGRFIGVCPNSDVLSDGVKGWFKENGNKYTAATSTSDGVPESNGDTNTNGTTAHAGDYSESSAPSWGNSIYSVRFPPPSSSLPPLAPDGSFRPPFGHKYTYYIAEAVDVPEFVVPWEAFRSIAERYGLEQRYRKGFLDIWNCEADPQRATNTGGGSGGANTGGWGQEPADDGQDSTTAVARELEQLGVRMGVIKHPGGPLCMTEEEKEAVAFYHGFCFVKT
ncbi:mRNA cap guanine-N7 methyltransferase [Exophiala xenobiotica]|uniref:mRNA cap guanine-N(7) methyltransferase n=1 Tax=Lithohypha guttulata TaxID=1690604 RepID=A0ABR0KJS8_9EURO|nr:mRNA cap guanine-N7 methyltransferase [Lithohypha guttulata]KAK5322794.1 mRNA cap guanine-N7 methyltransferase [Exophiala xenobiotica]